jgi:hypothetical protein
MNGMVIGVINQVYGQIKLKNKYNLMEKKTMEFSGCLFKITKECSVISMFVNIMMILILTKLCLNKIKTIII